MNWSLAAFGLAFLDTCLFGFSIWLQVKSLRVQIQTEKDVHR